MNESFLAKAIRWLVYASAFIPLVIFSQYMSPFHFGKVVVFRSIVQVMVALYLLLVWRDRSYAPKSHPITWAFLSFAIAFTITSGTSVAFLQSFWGTLERMGGLFSFWHYFLFYIITISVMRTRSDWRVLLNIMVGVGFASAIYGFLQKTDWAFILGSGGRQRPFGTIGNPALFAGYQILIAFLSLTLASMKRTSFKMKRWYFTAGGVMLLAVISTAVRGSLIGIVAGGLTWALLWGSLNRSRLARNGLLAGLTAIVVFVFLAMMLRQTSFVQNSPYLKRVTDFSSSTFTVQTRFWAWTAGYEGWTENFKTIMLGWGPENFNVPFSKHFNPKFFTGPGAETFFDRAHNMFVEVTVTMGLLGLISYLSIFAASFRQFARFMKENSDARVIGIGFASMSVAYIIHNCFIFDTSANFLSFFTLLAFVVHVAISGIDAAPIRGSSVRAWSGLQTLYIVVVPIIVFVSIYATNVRLSMANYASTRAIVAGYRGDWVSAVNKYREAIDIDAPGRYEYRHRYAQYLLELSGATDVSKVPNFKEVTLRAIEDVKQNTIENPDDYLPYLYLSRLYITLGKGDSKSPYNDEALRMSGKALEISPTFVRTYYEVAQAYLNKGLPESALEWFKKASVLNPDVAITYWYIGTVQYQIAASRNSFEGVKEALQSMNTGLAKGYTMTEQDGLRLIQIYSQLGDMKNVAAMSERLVVSFPKKADYWSLLINAYADLNEAQKVIETIRRALAVPEIAADKNFTEKADLVLGRLGAAR
ncbi:MAG: O-antigen ligase family protein [Candidatus Pacebacteria bacterium]|nr:O-antigen ligase family protein [Candidatus Paceibacterota bacterium]